jgi:hypothetical protein
MGPKEAVRVVKPQRIKTQISDLTPHTVPHHYNNGESTGAVQSTKKLLSNLDVTIKIVLGHLNLRKDVSQRAKG